MKNIQELSSFELLEINGGHQGTAYELGRSLGKALLIVATIVALL